MSALRSSNPPESAAAPEIQGRLEAYYTRYYRDVLAIPGWREHVAMRLDDRAYEGRRLQRLESALGRPVAELRVLNVGCGTGGFNALAERAGAVALGVDTDREAVEIARLRVRPGRIVCAPAETLPFRSGSVDVVYCYSTLEHVADARRALRELVRVLAPGGALYLHSPSRWSCFESHYKILWPPGLAGWPGRAYLGARGRPAAFLADLRPVTLRQCMRELQASGIRTIHLLDGGVDRRVGGALWPAVRLYYRLFRIRPYVELLAIKMTGGS